MKCSHVRALPASKPKLDGLVALIWIHLDVIVRIFLPTMKTRNELSRIQEA